MHTTLYEEIKFKISDKDIFRDDALGVCSVKLKQIIEETEKVSH